MIDMNLRWWRDLLWRIVYNPHFPPQLLNLFYNLTSEDFNLTIDPDDEPAIT